MLKTRSIVRPLPRLGPCASFTVSVMHAPRSLVSLSLLVVCRWSRPPTWSRCAARPPRWCTRRAASPRRAGRSVVSPWRLRCRSTGSTSRSTAARPTLGLLHAEQRDLVLEVVGGARTPCRRWRTAGRRPRRARGAGRGSPGRPRGPGTSAAPSLRSASSTVWPRQARSSSETGRPLQALRTPAIALSRVNGSVAPERLSTVSCMSSTVVNRFSQLVAAAPAADRRAVLGRRGSRGPWCRCAGSTGSASWVLLSACLRSTTSGRAEAPVDGGVSACGISGLIPVDNRRLAVGSEPLLWTTCGKPQRCNY